MYQVYLGCVSICNDQPPRSKKIILSTMNDPKKNILVVDDDKKIRKLLRRCLEQDGYNVIEAGSEQETNVALSDHEINLITLDLQLGADSGLKIAAKIREKSSVPIIMVTGKGDVIDKVVGLEMGADDYIAKPFHIREVQARVRSALRRQEMSVLSTPDAIERTKQTDATLSFDGWTANVDSFELYAPDGSECELTTTDFKLLVLFLKAPKRVLSRDQIMDELNGAEWTPFDRTIDNQVARLRKKIEADPSNPKYIKTVRGTGYVFAAGVEKS